jgi:hypothetical protein
VDCRGGEARNAARLEQSTSRLETALDKLESGAPPAPTETEFFAALKGRLKQGQAAYGDKSFAREPSELLGELEQEALDLAGWSFVLWTRLRNLKAAAAAAGVK